MSWILFLLTVFASDVLVLKNGKTIPCESYERSGSNVLITDKGNKYALPERIVDWERTKEAKLALEKEKEEEQAQAATPYLVTTHDPNRAPTRFTNKDLEDDSPTESVQSSDQSSAHGKDELMTLAEDLKTFYTELVNIGQTFYKGKPYNSHDHERAKRLLALAERTGPNLNRFLGDLEKQKTQNTALNKKQQALADILVCPELHRRIHAKTLVISQELEHANSLRDQDAREKVWLKLADMYLKWNYMASVELKDCKKSKKKR